MNRILFRGIIIMLRSRIRVGNFSSKNIVVIIIVDRIVVFNSIVERKSTIRG